jgi:hypothetical protein
LKLIRRRRFFQWSPKQIDDRVKEAALKVRAFAEESQRSFDNWIAEKARLHQFSASDSESLEMGPEATILKERNSDCGFLWQRTLREQRVERAF